MLTGVAVVFGYALLGATWLVLKTEGRLQRIAFDLTRPLMLAVIAFMLLVSAWLPFLYLRPDGSAGSPGRISCTSRRCLSSPSLNAALLWRAVLRNYELQPFVLSLCFFALGFLGLVVGIWPNIVPPTLTIWDAAAAPSSQSFALIGAIVMIPAVLGYTIYSYRVFRGKVRAGEGYAH